MDDVTKVFADEMVEVEIDIDDDLLLKLALRAHERNITLNALINEILLEQIKEMKANESPGE